MIIISHRGNLHGPVPKKENSPEYISTARLFGFDVEIDVWYVANQWFLGHDAPMYPVPVEFIKSDGLWCHAKNVDALENMLKRDIHCFWHQNDSYTLTSRGMVWAYPRFKTDGISVVEGQEFPTFKCAGICTDYASQAAIARNFS